MRERRNKEEASGREKTGNCRTRGKNKMALLVSQH